MDRERRNGALSWEGLSGTLGGSFAARASGLVAPEMILLTSGGERFGRLTSNASGETRFRAGNLEAEIQQHEGHRYEMMTGHAKTLTAEPAGSPTVLSLRSGGHLYEARISLFRNRTTARSTSGNETASLSGGLTSRRYNATFDPKDPSALPIAIFLLHHTTKLRREAYRTT
jgi:hypothetical protein